VAEGGHEDGLRRTVAWTRANWSTILRCVMQHVHFMPDLRRYYTCADDLELRSAAPAERPACHAAE
jgi:hypothetical protein